MSTGIGVLRTIIQEGIRIQRGTQGHIEYVDSGNALPDCLARQNHVVFGRRGCGKTLLLHETAQKVRVDIRVVYINCEDYKQHSFPNVLIEILDKLFAEFEKNLTGWFGRKWRSKELIQKIRHDLQDLKRKPDERQVSVRESTGSDTSSGGELKLEVQGINVGIKENEAQKEAVEKIYKQHDIKIKDLNLVLPRLKESIEEFFSISSDVKAVFLELDDFYHLPRSIQPHVADYIHRLCKDVPLFFKIATLRHSSVLFADRGDQPIGVQERHDYQPINVDFTFEDFARTARQVRQILSAYGTRDTCRETRSTLYSSGTVLTD